jgi:hypothetical protein
VVQADRRHASHTAGRLQPRRLSRARRQSARRDPEDRAASPVAELIIVETNSGDLILVDGHTRATAYAVLSDRVFPAFIGTSPLMDQWAFITESLPAAALGFLEIRSTFLCCTDRCCEPLVRAGYESRDRKFESLQVATLGHVIGAAVSKRGSKGPSTSCLFRTFSRCLRPRNCKIK